MKTHVVKIKADATIGEAVDLMDLYQVRALPVVDSDGVLCGILTERDVLQAMLLSVAPDTIHTPRDAAFLPTISGEQPARDFMSAPVQSISEHEDARHAAQALLTGGRKHLPVVDEKMRVVGMLCRVDALQAILEHLI